VEPGDIQRTGVVKPHKNGGGLRRLMAGEDERAACRDAAGTKKQIFVRNGTP